jgi:ankyrin repeat protein
MACCCLGGAVSAELAELSSILSKPRGDDQQEQDIKERILKLLRDNPSVNINAPLAQGLTPLQLAVVRGHLVAANTLVAKGADTKVLAKGTGFNLLQLSVASPTGNIKRCHHLIMRYCATALMCVRSHSWPGPLDSAGEVEVASWLQSIGFDVHTKTKSSDSLLHLACKNGMTSVVAWLLVQDVDIVSIFSPASWQSLHSTPGWLNVFVTVGVIGLTHQSVNHCAVIFPN